MRKLELLQVGCVLHLLSLASARSRPAGGQGLWVPDRLLWRSPLHDGRSIRTLQSVRYISRHERGGEVNRPKDSEPNGERQTQYPGEDFLLRQSLKHQSSIFAETELCESARVAILLIGRQSPRATGAVMERRPLPSDGFYTVVVDRGDQGFTRPVAHDCPRDLSVALNL
jgi:hypothetical protein